MHLGDRVSMNITSWNCANQSQVSHRGNISDQPPDSSRSYRATDSYFFMADGLSVWPVHMFGIPCRTACGIRLLAGTVSDNLWRRFCLQGTDDFSSLEVSRRCANYKSISFLHSYFAWCKSDHLCDEHIDGRTDRTTDRVTCVASKNTARSTAVTGDG